MAFLATAWCILTVVLGAKGVSFWWLFVLAAAGSILYSAMGIAWHRFWSAGVVPFMQWAIMVYLGEVAVAGILFLIGVGIGKLL